MIKQQDTVFIVLRNGDIDRVFKVKADALIYANREIYPLRIVERLVE